MGRYADDLALARRCADGDETAWERFIREYRPILYRAADALAPSGRARELADSLYADLYGVAGHGGERRSLLRYFEGRSSLATWLRAVLAQRFVDQVRAARRLEPLEADADHDSSPTGSIPASASAPDPDRLRFITLVRGALSRAVAALAARDRLRLGCYYVQDLTLAQVGRITGEHEATVSRQLARTRAALRRAVEADLRKSGLTDDVIRECLTAAAEDPGPLDLSVLVGADPPRKITETDRSTHEDQR
jgi:RNA polymerase sigma factor (sigma-70 family)